MKLQDAILRKTHRFFVHELPVFVFHHVWKEYNPVLCAKEDSTQIEIFKRNIIQLQKRYTFISMAEAIHHLQHDTIRLRNYAVLTSDDGFASVLEVLPWLIERKIPITLFICPKYLDGQFCIPVDEERIRSQFPDVDIQEVASRMFISREQLNALSSPLVTIGVHGYTHLHATTQTEKEFAEDVAMARKELQDYPLYQPYYAYPFGSHSAKTDQYVHQSGMIPVLCDGKTNYTWNGTISRICIDNRKL